MVKMKKIVINKKDLKQNLKIINSMKKKKCKIIGVVKANGMGLDLVKYSKFLVENNIKILAVSETEDAFTLRKNKITADILLLTPENDKKQLEKLVKNNIIITLASLGQAEILKELSEKYKKKIDVHLKIDTGMGRYGFLYNQYDEIIKTYEMNEYLNIKGIYTHFSNAINSKDTYKQFERFEKALDYIKQKGFKVDFAHCCNSTAFIKYTNMHLDAVRLGSIIQGRTLIKIENLKKIGEFNTNITQIKNLPIGYNIGYGNTYKTKKETKIAIIPVGHTDGFETRNKRDNFSFKENIKSICIEARKMFKKENAFVYIENKKYPVVGRIGLNYSVIDITGAEDVDLNSNVVLLSPPLNVNSVIRREYI